MHQFICGKIKHISSFMQRGKNPFLRVTAIDKMKRLLAAAN